MADKKTTRVQFEFTDDMIQTLNELIETTDSTSRAQVVRKSLKFYRDIQKLTKTGQLGITENGVFQPIIILQ